MNGRYNYTKRRLKNYIMTIDKNIATRMKGRHERVIKNLSESDKIQLNKIGLPVENMNGDFIKWPTFFDSGEDSSEVYVCPVCFGALIYAEAFGTGDIRTPDYQRQLKRAMRTIVVLRKADGSWPSKLSFDLYKYSGTINQTTISLSTLRKIGFFEEAYISGGNHSELLRAERFRFVLKSIRWLINAQRDADFGASWSYCSNNGTIEKDQVADASIMQTAYVYETLDKYYELFTDPDNKALVSAIDDQICEELRDILDRIEYFFSQISIDGGYPKLFNGNDDQPVFITNTCQVISALSRNPERNKELLTAAAAYLVENWRFKDNSDRETAIDCGLGFHFGKEEIFEKFQVVDDHGSVPGSAQQNAGENNETVKDIENYEKLPHTIILLACLDLLKIKDKINLNKKYIREIRKYAKKSLKMLVTRVEFKKHGGVIRGFRGYENAFPIYNMYYARLVFSRVVEKMEEYKIGNVDSIILEPLIWGLPILTLSGVFIATLFVQFSLFQNSLFQNIITAALGASATKFIKVLVSSLSYNRVLKNNDKDIKRMHHVRTYTEEKSAIC